MIKKFGVEKGWNNEKWNFLTREIYDKIMSRYEESNRKLAMEYFHRDQLFFEPFEEKNVIRPIVDFAPAEVLELNTRIVEGIYQQEVENNQQNHPSVKKLISRKTRSLFRQLGLAK